MSRVLLSSLGANGFADLLGVKCLKEIISPKRTGEYCFEETVLMHHSGKNLLRS